MGPSDMSLGVVPGERRMHPLARIGEYPCIDCDSCTPDGECAAWRYYLCGNIDTAMEGHEAKQDKHSIKNNKR